MTGIEIRNLVKQWGQTRAVDDVSFAVPQGTFTVLLGPSGCGKSTILRMIAGLEDVTSGEVLIGGDDVTRLDPAKRGVSMVFQSYALFPHLNVRENILFGLKVRRVPREEQEKRLQAAAAMVGLDELLDRTPAQLSGGQRQRVALSRTIVANQPVCLMDEPLSNLDAKLRGEMRDEICALQRKLGLTMVYVTHDQIEAMSMADQVVLLNAGRIEQIGTPAEIYETPATTFAASFLGTPPMNVMPVTSLADDAAITRLAPSAKADWQIGIRPEDVEIRKQGLSADVIAVDYMGAESLLRLRHGPQTIMSRVNGRSAVKAGDTLHVGWKPAAMHVFDEKGIRRAASKADPPKPS
jgi:sn-glycerol 3-phosphate transport system ATP-binding protein